MTNAPYEDGQLTVEGQGPFAPEDLVSDVFSRRFVQHLEDGTYKVVTDYYGVFAVEDTNEDFGTSYDIVNCVETTICRDPEEVSGTYIGSDHEFDYAVNYMLIDDPEDAIATARRLCEGLQIEHYSWES